MDLAFIRPAERGTIPNQISHLSWELTSLLQHVIANRKLALLYQPFNFHIMNTYGSEGHAESRGGRLRSVEFSLA